MKKQLKIVVLAKQVPDTRNVGKDAMTAEGTVNRAALPAIFNPEDLNALEAALQLKDLTEGSTVQVLTMGPLRAADVIREAMFRGADGGYLLSGREFAGADTLATSYALCKGVEQLGEFDLLLCGKMAVDGDTAQIGPELAERLGVPHVTDVEWLEGDEKSVTVRRQLGGSVQTLRVPLPAVLTVTRELNVPRLPSIAGVLRAEETEVAQYDVRRAGAEETLCGLKGSPTQVVQTYLPRRTRAVEEIEGTAQERQQRLVEIIKGEVRNGTGH
jgi:electron transfer flavoprotein beta subunit